MLKINNFRALIPAFQRIALFVGILLIQSPLFAKTITIQYQSAGAKEVALFWGINDWHTIAPIPANTQIINQVMQTKMQNKEGVFFCTINVPDDAFVNMVFGFQKKLTLIGPTGFYVDDNNQKNYLLKAGESNLFSIKSDANTLNPRNNISLFRYGCLVFFITGLMALCIFGLQYKKQALKNISEKRTIDFWSIAIFFLLSLLMIRLQTAQIQYTLLANPIQYIVAVSHSFIPDFEYVGIIGFIMGITYWLLKKQRRLILIVFFTISLLSIIVAIINISVVQVLGNPFNYPWLYYSDFLNSTDAKLAMKANIDFPFIAGNLLLLAATCCIFYLVNFFSKKNPIIFFSITGIFILPGVIFESNNLLPKAKRVNPIIHFVLSTPMGDLFQQKNNSANSEMAIKNIDTSAYPFSNSFKKSTIQNVLIIVLESTPAEYISVYDSSISTTPFLKSIQKNSLVFNSIYAHVPATNQSLVTLLTASNPYISFKSLTVEKPDIHLTSIVDVLKKDGYQAGFFNAGDNQFQNAAGFLKHHSFDLIQDFRSSINKADVLKDSRFSQANGDGITDSSLYDQFTEWHAKNPTKPFFGTLWTFQTHYPYYALGQTKNFGTGNINLERYLNGLSQADALIKKLYDYLKKQSLSESTLVVVVGDHGEAFGRHQQITHANGIYEENLHVPLLFINPGLFNGQEMNVVGGISDIAPSILAVLNKKSPDNWQGENLFSANRRKRVYFFSPYSDFIVGFREGNYKFIYNTSTNNTSLYNLTTDPKEQYDISEAHKPYIDSAKQAVNAWLAYQNNFINKLM